MLTEVTPVVGGGWIGGGGVQKGLRVQIACMQALQLTRR
jgi:hypothetical protein